VCDDPALTPRVPRGFAYRPPPPPLRFEFFAPEGAPVAHATPSFSGDAIAGGARRLCDAQLMVVGDKPEEHPVLAADVERCKRCERAARLCLAVGNMRPAQLLAEGRRRHDDPFYYEAAA
jgi:hypothetical protein